MYTDWQDEYAHSEDIHKAREEFEAKLMGAAFPAQHPEMPVRTDGGGQHAPETVEYGEDEVFDNPIPGIPNVKPLDM